MITSLSEVYNRVSNTSRTTFTITCLNNVYYMYKQFYHDKHSEMNIISKDIALMLINRFTIIIGDDTIRITRFNSDDIQQVIIEKRTEKLNRI